MTSNTILFRDLPLTFSFNPDIFYVNPYSIPFLLASIFVLLFGGFVYSRTRKTYQGLSFLGVCVTFFIWLAGTFLTYSTNEPILARYLLYLMYGGVSLISVALYWYVSIWLGQRKENKKSAIIGFWLGILFLAMIAGTDWIVYGIERYFWGYHSRLTVLGGIAYLIYFNAYLFLFYLTLYRGYKQEDEPTIRKQILFVAGSIIIAHLGCNDFLPCYGFEVFPIGGLTLLIAYSVLGYTLIRYHLFDIETVIHKTLMWAALSSLAVVPLAVIFYFSQGFLAHVPRAISSLLAAALFVAFLFYVRAIQPWIDHIFQRRNNDLKRELFKFNDNLVQLRGLSELSIYIVQTIRRVLYVNEVQLFLKNTKQGFLFRIDLAERIQKLDMKQNFIEWIEKYDAPVLAEYVKMDPHLQEIKFDANRFFKELKVKASIPLVLNGELIGLINLGQKSNLKPFRAAEVSFLSELRRAATIALSNSLRLIEMQENLKKWNEELEAKVLERTEELRETQKQLIQAEKLATIGILAGGVAHEINNPLTAVLTNAQILKMDAKSDDLESIELIEAGAKRCQEIIQKVMKYARKPLGPEKVESVNLNQVVDSTISFLKYQLEQEHIEVHTKKDSQISSVKGNANEFEQVLTNLILNAKDAVKDGKESGRIEIETLAQNGTVSMSVSDNGHGIKEEHISKIFDPFFTTKEIGKGTGLGLAVSYGIVKKYDGQIDVSSKIGKGTTFLVTFPLAK